MLLYREPGVSRIPPAELDRRNRAFQAGDWLDLLREAAAACTASAPGPRRNVASDDQARAHRAEALVHLGELSAANRALTAEPLAEWSLATLAELRDPARRPAEPYGPHSDELLRFQPELPCPFPQHALVSCLQSARQARPGLPTSIFASCWMTRRIAVCCMALLSSSPAHRCPLWTLLPSGSDASLPCVSPTKMCCAALLDASWPNSFPHNCRTLTSLSVRVEHVRWHGSCHAPAAPRHGGRAPRHHVVGRRGRRIRPCRPPGHV